MPCSANFSVTVEKSNWFNRNVRFSQTNTFSKSVRRYLTSYARWVLLRINESAKLFWKRIGSFWWFDIFIFLFLNLYGVFLPFSSSFFNPQLPWYIPSHCTSCLFFDGCGHIEMIKVWVSWHRRRKRGGVGGGQPPLPPIIWEGGPTYPLAPPIIHPPVLAKLFLSILSLNFL